MFQQHAPLHIKPDGSLWQLQWMLKMLQNCNTKSYEVNKSRMVRLAEYSRDCLEQLRDDIGIQYQSRTNGTLQVFRTKKQLAAAQKDMTVLERCGVEFSLLDNHGCTTVEPALALIKDKLVGGLHLPGDETGDCQLFTTSLAEEASKLCVQFRQNIVIKQFLTSNGKLRGVEIQSSSQTEILQADQYVVALGSYSGALMQSLNIGIPVYPVKGYSLTIPIVSTAASPISTVMDETYKVAITRLNNRIRVGGMAELAGFDLSLNPKRRATLEMVTQSLFPHAGDLSNASFWTGLRPMTSDGTPIIGRVSNYAQHENLWLNTGNGTLGWTMACGSGQVLADLLADIKPAIKVDDFSLNRYDSGQNQMIKEAIKPAHPVKLNQSAS